MLNEALGAGRPCHYTIELGDYGSGVLEVTANDWRIFSSTRNLPRRDGILYVCPRCAKTWAVFKVEGRDYALEPGLCEAHPPEAFPSLTTMIPGSLWRPWNERHLSAAPREVILREFLLHLDFFERYTK